MTAQLLLLGLLVAASVVAVVALRQERRWRTAAARVPLPVAGVGGRMAAIVGASAATKVLRGSRWGRAGLGGSTRGYADVDAADVDSVVAGRPRTVRPARLVVSGASRPVAISTHPALPAAIAPVAFRHARSTPMPPAAATERVARTDPRARLLRDTAGVVALGAAFVLALSLMPRSPDLEAAVLGATATPETRTPLPAIVSRSPSPGPSDDTLAADPSPSPDAEAAGSDEPGLEASPSIAAAATPTPRPTATPRRVTPTPRATPTAAPSSGTSPSPDASPSVEPTPTPEPSPSAAASATPSSAASAAPSAAPSVEPTPEPTPTPEPSPSSAPSEPVPSPDATASPTPSPT